MTTNLVYVEAYGEYGFRIYTYDVGERNIIRIHKSEEIYESASEARNAGVDWCEDNNIPNVEVCY